MDCLNKLFPTDLINIILPYGGKELVLDFQQYYPHLLKHITVYSQDLIWIDKNNYKYIIKLDCSHNKEITDETISSLVNLTELYCVGCDQLTVRALKYLTNLIVLNCAFCGKITDQSIGNLVNLTELNSIGCNLITDKSIMHLTNLLKLNFTSHKITDKSIIFLTNVVSLYCYDNSQISNVSISKLINLLELDCERCPHITQEMIQIIMDRGNN